MGKLVKISIFFFLIALAVAITSFYFLVKMRYVVLNPLFVSVEKDVVGVDISHYQGKVDIAKLAEQRMKFAYLKATEGSSYQDGYFAENWQNAKSVQDEMQAEGKQFYTGAYHFFSFESSGETQAQNFIATVGDLSGRLVPVLDLEFYGKNKDAHPQKEAVITEVESFLDTLETYYSVKPMIYANAEIYRLYLKDNFSDYPLWFSSPFFPISLYFQGDWTIWQYTDRGELEGYNGSDSDKYIDLNVLNKDKDITSLVVR